MNDRGSGIASAWREFAAELGCPVQPGAGASEVADLIVRSRTLLGATPPPEFLALLRDQNGGEVNGLRFYPTRDLQRPHGSFVSTGLVQANLDVRESGWLADHVVLAEGSITLFALHVPSQAFHEVGRVPPDVLVVHDSFDDLMAAAIDAHRSH